MFKAVTNRKRRCTMPSLLYPTSTNHRDTLANRCMIAKYVNVADNLGVVRS